mmetsp:Transcript_74286/g.149596  ORF Transcript_74286/g.149596 Transcript_74286/m.149596 type:complete len:94 (-) Transcript_74286:138-419(-)
MGEKPDDTVTPATWAPPQGTSALGVADDAACSSARSRTLKASAGSPAESRLGATKLFAPPSQAAGMSMLTDSQKLSQAFPQPGTLAGFMVEKS